MKLHVISALAALSLAVGGCAQADKCAQAKDPNECRAWTDAGGNIDDYLVGGMIGYMMANQGGRTVVVRDPYYHGPVRHLRAPIPSRDVQVKRLNDKIARQRVELKRQQAANARKSAELRSYRSSSSRSSSYRSSSYRSSSRSGRR